jgi:hypothetical protein
MERLNDLLAEKSLERNSLANELKVSRRNTMNGQASLTLNSPKTIVSINAHDK